MNTEYKRKYLATMSCAVRGYGIRLTEYIDGLKGSNLKLKKEDLDEVLNIYVEYGLSQEFARVDTVDEKGLGKVVLNANTENYTTFAKELKSLGFNKGPSMIPLKIGRAVWRMAEEAQRELTLQEIMLKRYIENEKNTRENRVRRALRFA